MKKTILKIVTVAALAVLTALSLASCDMLPEPILELLGAKTECTHTEVEWVVDIPSTCKVEGTQHSECKECGAIVEGQVKLELGEHTLGDWEVDYESDCLRAGSKFRKCSVCKKKVETEEIPIIDEHSYSLGICTVCKVAQPASEGLEFTSLGGDTAELKSIGDCKDTSLVIPELTPSGERVISIASGAFLNQSGITSVIIPDSVTSAGADAFFGCSIAKARVPAAVVASVRCNTITELRVTGSGQIPASAMIDAPNLSSVVIDEGVTGIGDNAFSGCQKLGSVYMSNSILTVGMRAFARCTALTSVRLGTGVVTIGDHAFNNAKSIRSIVIPASVNYIGVGAFASFTAGSSKKVNISELKNVTFEVTEGWYSLASSDDTAGISIDPATLESSTRAAVALNETYAENFIKRN